jgi:class 3 adenylate cyclase
MVADAAGYSRLMALDERATLGALDTARETFRAGIEANGGRVVDMAGDSVLAVFETAFGAVTAALAIQAQLDSTSQSASQGRCMPFRIGVHLGDVIVKADGTVYGDGVNIAARLQALAEPGGVAISDAVRGAVKGKVDVSFLDQGEQAVKNIPDPLRAFKLARQARCPEARVALVEFFEASRRTGWHRLGNFSHAFVELALHEHRHLDAARLLGYARAAWGRGTLPARESRKLLATLQSEMNATSLERLLVEGKELDQEAVCALTLETAPSG